MSLGLHFLSFFSLVLSFLIYKMNKCSQILNPLALKFQVVYSPPCEYARFNIQRFSFSVSIKITALDSVGDSMIYLRTVVLRL